jgi:hypothetical protein
VRTLLSLLALFLCLGATAQAQLVDALPDAPSALISTSAPTQTATGYVATSAGPAPQLVCPGEFPTNVLIINCKYKPSDRWNNFIINSVSDQAMLSSIVGSLGSQLVRSPAEWPETWKYYGYRLGASYGGGIARGTVELAIGSALHSDPRHVRCEEDPLLISSSVKNRKHDIDYGHCHGFKGQAFYRPLHVFTDALTVRKSQADGAGFRFPAIERYAGVYAASYASYPWQPREENTFGAVSRRAGLAYLITFVGSAWNEYGPSISAKFNRTPTRTIP